MFCESHAVFPSPQLDDVQGPCGRKAIRGQDNEGKLSSWRPPEPKQFSLLETSRFEKFACSVLCFPRSSPSLD